MAGGINVASLFATFGADTTGLQKGLGGAKKSLTDLGGSMTKQIIGAVSLTAALATAGKFVQSSVSDWADYADSMRLSADMAGITTEEMSRLAQAADDFRVPIGTMQSAMEMALKNGFTPTIANIADLSDKLMGIEDPASRAAAASKIFGKSYADIMPFLMAGGDAIRTGTASIGDNLIVTAKAALEAKAYKDAIDELSDSWTGVKNLLGKSLAPAATILLQDLTGDLEEVVKQFTYLSLAKQAFDQGLVQEGDVWAAYAAVFTSDITQPEYWEGLAAATAKYNDMLGNTPKEVEVATSSFNLMGVELDNISTEFNEQKTLIGKDLVEAYGKLQTATDNYRGGVAGDLVQGLKDAGLQGESLLEKLGWIDDYAGTDYALDYKMELATPELITALMEGEDPFKDATAAFDEEFLPLQESVIAANTEIDNLKANLALLERDYFIHVYEITHKITTNQPTWSPPVQRDLFYGPGRANGGPVSGNSPYLVGERGPELFVPESNGSIVPNGQSNSNGGGNYALLDALTNIPTARDIARAVRDAMLMVAG